MAAKMKKNLALILAGGSGTRMQNKTAKQFAMLEGKPVICYSLDIFKNHPDIEGIIA